MKNKSVFRNRPSMMLTLVAMTMSAAIIYKVFPKPGNDIAGCKQTCSGKCSSMTECKNNNK